LRTREKNKGDRGGKIRGAKRNEQRPKRTLRTDRGKESKKMGFCWHRGSQEDREGKNAQGTQPADANQKDPKKNHTKPRFKNLKPEKG